MANTYQSQHIEVCKVPIETTITYNNDSMSKKIVPFNPNLVERKLKLLTNKIMATNDNRSVFCKKIEYFQISQFICKSEENYRPHYS